MALQTNIHAWKHARCFPGQIHCRTAPVLHRQDRIVSLTATSIDPLASRTTYSAGFTLPVHSEEQLNALIEEHKEKLIVLMCKSSHCKPCKAFMQTYHQLAERFADSVLLELTGDETPALRALMKSWAVKVTPTFRIYRGGELIETKTGTSNDKLLKAILEKLKDGERGRDWTEVTHEELADEES